ncbi:MAG: Unknown protein [uncultured Sulfurovum sp.]|uniref:Outer membrane protein n=1 Tax=uncultured Sulfurovum sp. TaxID=269237 RepID=A0A6S6SVU4_9BACT|nr:MAG: Unknown protein [uncultured Sulfurovum sp.]
MKISSTLFLSMFLITAVYAEKEEHHEHVGTTNIKLNYEILDFENSKKKTDGKRYGVEIDQQSNAHHYRVYYERTDTETTAVLPKDLEVNKYALKYDYSLNKKNSLSLSYINIDDNLMKETDGGNIYGIGYKHKALTLTQYLSDYDNFDVYQTDLKFGMKKKFDKLVVKGGVIGKYIHLKNKDSNNFSKKAKTDYFTTGLKVHADYGDYHASAGTYMGTRVFAVMNEGLQVQHHAMEFKESYMVDVGKKFDQVLVHLRYAKHNAKEIPIDNDHVKVENIAFDLEYQF